MVLEMTDKVGLDPAESMRNNVSEALQRCHDLDARLEVWYGEYLSSSPSPKFTTIPTEPDQPGTISPPFPTIFTFASVLAAHTLSTFWALQIVLGGTVTFILCHLTDEVIDHSVRTLRDRHTPNLLIVAARNILRSVPYCFQPSMGAMGSQRMLFPLRLAMHAFHRAGGSELDYCRAMFQCLAKEKGLRYSAYIARGLGKWKGTG